MKIYYIIGVVNDLVSRIYDYNLHSYLYIFNDINGLKLSSTFFQSVTNVTKTAPTKKKWLQKCTHSEVSHSIYARHKYMQKSLRKFLTFIYFIVYIMVLEITRIQTS